MPRKTKYTREDVISVAINLVRDKGVESLSARSLAAALGVSTAPIFTLFDGIDDVLSAVVDRAKALHESYIIKGREHSIPFKGMGIMYIKFAKEEPRLFEMLFMKRKAPSECKSYLPGNYFMGGEVLSLITSGYFSDRSEAMSLYNHLSVYVFGLATLSALGSSIFSDEDIEKMLSEAFISFKGALNEKSN